MAIFRIETFEDLATKAIRDELRAEHLAYLEEHIDSLYYAAGRLDAGGSDGHGSSYILEAETMAGAEAFLQNEPYMKAGIITGFDIKPGRIGILNRQWFKA